MDCLQLLFFVLCSYFILCYLTEVLTREITFTFNFDVSKKKLDDIASNDYKEIKEQVEYEVNIFPSFMLLKTLSTLFCLSKIYI